MSFLRKEKEKCKTKLTVGFAGKDEIEEYLERVAQTGDKGFEEHLIAYIDFLGIKERMQKNSSYESLQILKFILENAKKKAAYISDINTINNFDIKVFSDNIVFAQIINKDKLCDQIISIVNLIALIQFEAFFQFDFPIRGGITIGELYIDNSIVWGTGLIDAYSMESFLANYPRVLVSPNILKLYEECENKTLNLYALIKKDNDGAWFVDYLMAAPNLKLIPEISASLFDKSKAHENDDPKVRQKINWIISYFNSYCYKFKDRGDYERYIIPFI